MKASTTKNKKETKTLVNTSKQLQTYFYMNQLRLLIHRSQQASQVKRGC